MWITDGSFRCGQGVGDLWAACLSIDHPCLVHGGISVIHISIAQKDALLDVFPVFQLIRICTETPSVCFRIVIKGVKVKHFPVIALYLVVYELSDPNG